MDAAGATIPVPDTGDLSRTLDRLIGDEDGRAAIQNRAYHFAATRRKALPRAIDKLAPLFEQAGIPKPRHNPRDDED
jgi:hypothetical protein